MPTPPESDSQKRMRLPRGVGCSEVLKHIVIGLPSTLWSNVGINEIH